MKKTDKLLTAYPSLKKAVRRARFKRLAFSALKALKYVFYLIVAVVVLLQMPFVQTWLGHIASEKISEVICHKISIQKLSINWFDNVSLKKLEIRDLNNRDLIWTEELEVDFDLFNLLYKGDVYVQKAVFRKASVNLIQDGSVNIDDFISAIIKATSPKTKSKKKKTKPPYFFLGEINLKDCTFAYNAIKADTMPDPAVFDHNHFTFAKINAKVDRFRMAYDTMEMRIEHLNGIEKEMALPIQNFSAFFRYTKRNMSFDGLEARFGQSVIRDSLAFKYQSTADFGDFIGKVKIHARLDSSILYMSDLAHFAPVLKQYPDVFTIKGVFNGQINDFNIKNMELGFGATSLLKGKVVFKGLPDFHETLIDLNFEDSQIDAEDTKLYVSGHDFAIAKKFGLVAFNADFFGFPGDFVAKGDFNTRLGHLSTDVKLVTDHQSYKGTIATHNFRLAELIGSKGFADVMDMKGTIEGSGFRQQNAKFKLDATATRLRMRGYDYQNIYTKGTFEKQLFDGHLTVNDSNLVLKADAKINLIDSIFDVDASLEKCDLKKLKLSKEEASFSSIIIADFKGLSPESINGEIDLVSSKIAYKGHPINLDYFSLITDIVDGFRHLDIHSNILDFSMEGHYRLDKLLREIQHKGYEYGLNFIQKDSLTKAYYHRRDSLALFAPQEQEHSLTFKIDFKETSEVFPLFVKGFYLSDRSKISGDMLFGDNFAINASGNADTVSYKGYNFFGNSFDLASSKRNADTGFELALTAASDKQSWSQGVATDKLWLTADWEGNGFEVQSSIRHSATNDSLALDLGIDFFDGRQEINIHDLRARLVENHWKMEAPSQIKIIGETIKIDQFELGSGRQRIGLFGDLTRDTSAVLLFTADNFDLNVFSHYIGMDLQGVLSGNAAISDPYAQAKLKSGLSAQGLSLGGHLLGDMDVSTFWDNKEKQLGINAGLLREGQKILEAKGRYKPSAAKNKLLIDVKLKETNIDVIEALFAEDISNMSGTATGNLLVSGDTETPLFTGDLFLNKVKFTINYLQTTYTVNDKIYFTEDQIGMDRLKITDEHSNSAYLTGGLFHTGMKNFAVQLSGDLQQFMVINTKAKDNPLFYGTAIATGDVDFFGPVNNMGITVNAKSEKGTKIYIPLDGYAGVEHQDFIRFLKSVKTDTVQQNTAEAKKESASRLKMNLNFDVTPDAYCEIIFDKKVGDVIRGTGKGKLKMEIDTEGDFNMFGDIEIVKGTYNFTLLNAINKEFGVKPNSRISWSGDPYGAKLDLRASYTQMASLQPILDINSADSIVANSPELKRRYPVEVLLDMKGDLLSPTIAFNIDVSGYPSMVMVNGTPVSFEYGVSAFKHKVKTDEQELNKQVFSLMVLKKLSPKDAFSGIGGTAGNSVSELLTNQLSYWISQVDENLQIDLDLNGLDAEALNAFQLNFSYTFGDGRFRVSRNGGFTNVRNDADMSSILGDITLEYILSKDGKLRMKVYHKNNAGTLGASLENNSAGGVGLLHTLSFDNLRDFFGMDKYGKRAARKADKKTGQLMRDEEIIQ